jgi:Cu(I)/Ag(I) efflux system membrane fusion protein
MNKRSWAIVITILAFIGYWATKKIFEKSNKTEKTTFTKFEGNSYWTCPMHPQIHLDHEGECPICHMKLVKISEASKAQINSTSGDRRADVNVSDNQLVLAGLQKSKVERMSLTAKIPVSGRILSSSSVAFQVYESDLHYVRSGLSFKGESSMSSEDEISGTITSVDNFIDPTSRTVRVVGHLKTGSKAALTETSFSGEIIIDLKDRLAIPESSVLHTGNADIVYVFGEANKLTAKKVKLGLKTEGFYEVLSGLSEGTEISSGPNFLIDSEAKIRGAND